MNDKALIQIIAVALVLHFLIAIGYLVVKMRGRKKD